MIVLDENIPGDQCLLLEGKGVRFRKIGLDVGWNGMSDVDIIPLLHELDRPTLFSRDEDYFGRELCHRSYCLVYLDIRERVIAEYVRRVLRHSELRTKAKRLGKVIRVHPTGLSIWKLYAENEVQLDWEQ